MQQFRKNLIARTLTATSAFLLLAPATLMQAGCVAAGAAGAGAATGIYLTTRGIEGLAKGTPRELEQRTREAFDELGLQIVSSALEEAGQERTLRGVAGNLEVTVELSQESANTTMVEVTAKRDTLTWDKEYAKRVFEEIVGRG